MQSTKGNFRFDKTMEALNAPTILEHCRLANVKVKANGFAMKQQFGAKVRDKLRRIAYAIIPSHVAMYTWWGIYYIPIRTLY